MWVNTVCSLLIIVQLYSSVHKYCLRLKTAWAYKLLVITVDKHKYNSMGDREVCRKQFTTGRHREVSRQEAQGSVGLSQTCTQFTSCFRPTNLDQSM